MVKLESHNEKYFWLEQELGDVGNELFEEIGMDAH